MQLNNYRRKWWVTSKGSESFETLRSLRLEKCFPNRACTSRLQVFKNVTASILSRGMSHFSDMQLENLLEAARFRGDANITQSLLYCVGNVPMELSEPGVVVCGTSRGETTILEKLEYGEILNLL
jgi:hypothetical protein